MKGKKMRAMKKTNGQVGGFSLLEVLVAMAVLSFGVLGMAQLFLVAIQNNRRAAQNTESSAMISHRLEQYREIDYCILKVQALADGGAWRPDFAITGNFANTGQNAGTDGRAIQGRSDARVGGPVAGVLDWIIERRMITKSMGLVSIKDELGNNQAIPGTEDVLLIEIRGYRAGVQGQGAEKKYVQMSTYRTKRNVAVVC